MVSSLDLLFVFFLIAVAHILIHIIVYFRIKNQKNHRANRIRNDGWRICAFRPKTCVCEHLPETNFRVFDKKKSAQKFRMFLCCWFFVGYVANVRVSVEFGAVKSPGPRSLCPIVIGRRAHRKAPKSDRRIENQNR